MRGAAAVTDGGDTGGDEGAVLSAEIAAEGDEVEGDCAAGAGADERLDSRGAAAGTDADTEAEAGAEPRFDSVAGAVIAASCCCGSSWTLGRGAGRRMRCTNGFAPPLYRSFGNLTAAAITSSHTQQRKRSLTHAEFDVVLAHDLLQHEGADEVAEVRVGFAHRHGARVQHNVHGDKRLVLLCIRQ